MFRALFLSIGFLLLQGTALRAQESSFDLQNSEFRGSASDGFSDGDDTNLSEDNLADTGVNDVANADSVVGLRRAVNSATAEDGSTGLTGAGRIQAVRPFADRLAGVGGLRSGDSVDDTVFDGETTFDAAEGIRLGTFTIIPEVTLTTGWSDNRAQSSTGTPGKVYRIAPNITATSGWARHQLDFALRGSYRGFPGDSEDNEPNLTASTGLRLDLTASTTMNADAAYTFSREESSSAENISGDSDQHQLTGNLSVTRNAGLAAVTLGTGIDRNIYASDGGSGSSSRDNSLYSASLRLDSNGGGVLSPFVEGSLLLRRFDVTCSDALCEKRDANGYQLRGGVGIAAGPKLTGEIGAGWRIEDIEDNRLEALSGLVVDGSLVWSASQLTTVTAGLGTSFEATDLDNVSGSIIYSGDLRVAHEFSDRFVGETGVGYNYRTYQGASIEETTLTGVVGLTYALTRNLAFRTAYTYRNFDSSIAGNDYQENSIEAGLRFRH